MKILWLSNRVLSDSDNGSTGTWLIALSDALKNIPFINLGNIADANVSKMEIQKNGTFQQWLIPWKDVKKNGMPKREKELLILKIIFEFKPDLIHVWGTESYWGTITGKLVNDFPVLVEIQGLKKEIAGLYGADLTFLEKIKCIGLKEFIKRDSIFHRANKYKKWGQIELDIIKKHFLFSTHSNWAESKVLDLNKTSKIYKNERLLRPEFYSSSPWSYNKSLAIFTSAGYSAPFKGLHTLIRAVAQLKEDYPLIRLYIAGANQLTGIRRDGYINFVLNEIKRRGLTQNVIWLGPLNANRIIEYMKISSVSVFPSFIESYGLALTESMAIGIPTVAANNGGYSYQGKDNESVLFFQPGDSSKCAFQIKRILEDKDLSIRLSNSSRRICFQRNDYNSIIKNQIGIYEEILTSK